MEIKCGLTSRGKFNFPFLQTCFTIKLSLAFPVNYIKCITFPPNQNVFINILLLKLVPFGQKGKGGKGKKCRGKFVLFFTIIIISTIIVLSVTEPTLSQISKCC